MSSEEWLSTSRHPFSYFCTEKMLIKEKDFWHRFKWSRFRALFLTGRDGIFREYTRGRFIIMTCSITVLCLIFVSFLCLFLTWEDAFYLIDFNGWAFVWCDVPQTNCRKLLGYPAKNRNNIFACLSFYYFLMVMYKKITSNN